MLTWVLVGVGAYAAFVFVLLWAGAGWRRVRERHALPPRVRTRGPAVPPAPPGGRSGAHGCGPASRTGQAAEGRSADAVTDDRASGDRMSGDGQSDAGESGDGASGGGPP